MGAAASLSGAEGSQTTEGGGFMAKMRAMTSSAKKYEDKGAENNEEELDEDEDINDMEKLQKAHRKLGFEHARTVSELQEQEAQNKELRSKLSEMITAIKQLKSELNQTVTDKEAAEAHLAQMANPEREAFMHKYALEKLREEFEKYQKDVAEEKANLKRDLRRLQENLANRSSADDAAKASLQAEIRELKSQRGLMQFFDGQLVEPSAPASPGRGGGRGSPKGGKSGSPRSPKGGKGKASSPKGSKYPVADFDPSSGLKPKSEQVVRAAGVVVETEDGEVLDTRTEALAKRKEAAARTGREYLVEKGVLPPDEEGGDMDDEDEQAMPLPKIVEYVMDKEAATEMYAPDAYLQRRAQEEWDEDDMIPGEGLVDIVARDVDCHKQYMHSFGTHLTDAYDTPPFVVRQDTVDVLAEFVLASDHGLAVVIGDHGMGKSHVMAALGGTLELELGEACLATRSSARSLWAVVRALATPGCCSRGWCAC